MSRSVARSLVLGICLLALACAGGATAAAPSDPTEGDPGELEVQLLDDTGTMLKSYQPDVGAGSINVTNGGGTWTNVTIANRNETALAIQWALDDGTGSTVLVGPGTYNGTVSVTGSDRTIRGQEGPSKTVLTGLPGNETGILIDAENTTIADLSVDDYEPDNQGSIDPVDSEGLIIRSSDNRLTNLRVSGVDNGIVIKSGIGNRIERSVFSGFDTRGIEVAMGSSDTTILDSDFTPFDGSYGVYTSADNTTVRNNTLHSIDQGIFVAAAANHTTVRGNEIESSSFRGIWVKGSHALVFDNVVTSQRFSGISTSVESAAGTFRNNTVNGSREEAGIVVRGVDHRLERNVVTDNNLTAIVVRGGEGIYLGNTTAARNLEHGIVVNDSLGTTIASSVLDDNGGNAIRIVDGSNGTHVEDATVTNTGHINGIHVENSFDVVLGDSTLSSRIFLNASPRATVRNNSVGGNRIVLYGGSDYGLIEDNELDGASLSGISVEKSAHGTVRGNTIHLSGHGVHLGDGARNVTVSQNTATNGTDGIYLDVLSPGGHTVWNNTLRDNRDGIRVGTSDNTIGRNDAVNNSESGIYLSGAVNNTLVRNEVRQNAKYGIYLDTADENLLKRNTASNNSFGFRLTGGSKNEIRSNTAKDNEYGILLQQTQNNTVENSTFANNTEDGISLISADGNVVRDNDVNNDDYGIYLLESAWNTIEGNRLHENDDGLVAKYATNNSLTGNNASENEFDGFRFLNSQDNTLTDSIANENGESGFEIGAGTYANEFHAVTARGNGATAYSAVDVVNGTNTVYGLDVGADAASDVTLDVVASNVSVAAFDGSVGTPSSELNGLGGLFNVSNTTSPLDARLAFRYTDADVSDLDESSIGLWNYSAGNWTERSDAYHDANADGVAVRLTNTSLVGLFAEESSSSSGGLPSPSLPGGSGSDDGPIELSFHDVDASADRVAPGETVTVTVTVRNEDDRSGTRDLALADGATVLDEIQVTLAAGEERRISFEGEVAATGTYEFALDGDALATIEVAEAVSDGADDGDGAADDAADEGEADDAAAASGDGRGPWVVVGVLVVGVAGAVAYVRQDQVRAGLAGGRARLAPLGTRLGPLWDRAAPLRERSALLRERSALLRERLDAFRERRNGRR